MSSSPHRFLTSWEFPGGEVAKTLPVVPKQRATGSIPSQGIRSHML